MKKNRVVAIIPARSGSKTLKDKNIRIMAGKPMIAYSIIDGKSSKYIDDVVVSTDSEKYASIARYYGANVPFLRPECISSDSSLDIEVFQHYLRWLSSNGRGLPEILVHLRPTHPVRDIYDIDKMISILINNPEIDSIRSVAPSKEVPYKMWLFDDSEENIIKPLVSCHIPEAYNAPIQSLPKVYIQNECIDVVRVSTIINKNSMTGNRIAGYKMSYDFYVDTEEDFIQTELFLSIINKIKNGEKLKIVCDIDGVIAQKTTDNNYENALPNISNISILNKLHQKGHTICLHTARGYVTGLDWSNVTNEQLIRWGVPFDELKFGKPNADIYIDDKFGSLSKLSLFI